MAHWKLESVTSTVDATYQIPKSKSKCIQLAKEASLYVKGVIITALVPSGQRSIVEVQAGHSRFPLEFGGNIQLMKFRIYRDNRIRILKGT